MFFAKMWCVFMIYEGFVANIYEKSDLSEHFWLFKGGFRGV